MKSKKWLSIWFVIVFTVLFVLGLWVYKIDPYFHYHKPDLTKYYYDINNQRSQNNGIIKFFEYDALITGTSMTENFKSSEMDELFGVNSIKVPFNGSSYKEINDNLTVALENNPNLKTIIRCLDYGKIFDDKDVMRYDMGTYPTYLYDDNPFNDVQYLFNKDVIFKRAYSMTIKSKEAGFTPGMTSFDIYSVWQYGYENAGKFIYPSFGVNKIYPNGIFLEESDNLIHLTEVEKETIYGNITQNVTSLADLYPDVDFYYFFSPYSVAWWATYRAYGSVTKQIEGEQYAIELILQHPNIHLYSFNNIAEITTDLNNYEDTAHYGQWVNSLMLKWIKDGKGFLTKDNYRNYIDEELQLYLNFDFYSLPDQPDYEDDFYAAALFNKELKGVEPYLLHEDCAEAQIYVDEIGDYGYLVFNGRKINDNGLPSVSVYDEQGIKVEEITSRFQRTDNEWHQYVIDLSKIDGALTIIFDGGNIDNNGSTESSYEFSNISLY